MALNMVHIVNGVMGISGFLFGAALFYDGIKMRSRESIGVGLVFIIFAGVVWIIGM